MRYILTSRSTGKDHLVDQPTLKRMAKHHSFHRRYIVQEIGDRVEVPQELKEPIDIDMAVVDKRKKRVEEPKTENND
jgi:hypothetical protein